MLVSYQRPYLFSSRKTVEIFARFLLAICGYVKERQKKKSLAEEAVIYRWYYFTDTIYITMIIWQLCWVENTQNGNDLVAINKTIIFHTFLIDCFVTPSILFSKSVWHNNIWTSQCSDVQEPQILILWRQRLY